MTSPVPFESKKRWHVVDFVDDCVYSVNIPTLKQAEEIADYGHNTSYPNGGLSIIQDDDLTPKMINEINDAIDKGRI